MALLLTATMISLVTVGCTSKAPDSPSSVAPAATQASKGSESDDHEEVVLEVQIVDTNWAEAWNEMKATFENEYPWITLESVGAQQNFDAFISTRRSGSACFNQNYEFRHLSKYGRGRIYP